MTTESDGGAGNPGAASSPSPDTTSSSSSDGTAAESDASSGGRGGRPRRDADDDGKGRDVRRSETASRAPHRQSLGRYFENRSPGADRPSEESERSPRNRGDRPPRRDDRPRDDRTRGDRPPRRDDRPRDDRTRGDRPPRRDDRPRGDRPPRRDDRPRGDRPPRRDDRPRGDRPPRRDDRPRYDDRSRGDRPPRRDDRSRGDRPPRRDDRPRYDDRSRGERPRYDHDPGADSRPPRDPRPPTPAAQARRQAGHVLSDVDTLEVTVEKLISGGDGIARHEGIPIFIPRSAPGDRLRVRIVERKPSFGRAEILDILKPGQGRREAPCPHYGECGGCQLQHLEEAQQLRFKAQAARDNLERLGGIEMPSKVNVLAGDPWNYRLRTQWQLAETPRGRQAGYYQRGSHDLVVVDSCPILAPELNRRLPEVQAAAADISHRRLDVCVGAGDQWAVSPTVPGLPGQAVRMKVGELTYSYDAGCFFQAHRHLVEKLVHEAMGDTHDAEDGDEQTAYDLYAGVGLFSLPLAKRYGQVVAVEGGREAARYGRRNAQLNRLNNVEVVNQAVDTWVAKLPANAARVLVDPPRVGLSGPVRQALLDRRPRRLTYVSCDSATLARDLKYLKSAFRIVSLSLLDMFPQTGHLEAVVQLENQALAGR